MASKFGLPEGVDPNHEFVYRTGQYGIYDFWWKDRTGNYWAYTNAPKEHPLYDPYAGEAFIVPDQPMPHTTPNFYEPISGRKMSMGLPPGIELVNNLGYDPLNPSSIWMGMYQDDEDLTRFVYFDSDIRENLDLWVQYQIRVVDAVLVRYRQYASHIFTSTHPKDKVVATILMLVDQGCYEPIELVNAKVEDVEYIDSTVKLLGRKINPDPSLLDFFTSLTSSRSPNEPLFVLDTRLGRVPIGPRYMYSIFKALKMPTAFLRYWHASHIYSRIVHRLAASQTPIEEVEERAFGELARTIGTTQDVTALVDLQVRRELMSAYGQTVQKSVAMDTDDFAVLPIYVDLTAKRPDEYDFSVWLQQAPLHDMDPEEEARVDEHMDMAGEMADEEEGGEEGAGKPGAPPGAAGDAATGAADATMPEGRKKPEGAEQPPEAGEAP